WRRVPALHEAMSPSGHMADGLRRCSETVRFRVLQTGAAGLYERGNYPDANVLTLRLGILAARPYWWDRRRRLPARAGHNARARLFRCIRSETARGAAAAGSPRHRIRRAVPATRAA